MEQSYVLILPSEPTWPDLTRFADNGLGVAAFERGKMVFESINPAAYGFQLKYFTAYTHSVVRRIDELIIENKNKL